MTALLAEVQAREPESLPATWPGVQPGIGLATRLELYWGSWRRRWLRRFRTQYVTRMQQARLGSCPGCTHDVVDARDLKFTQNVCGYRFPADPFAWRGRLGFARHGLFEVLLYGGGSALVALLCALWSFWLSLPFLLFALAAAAFFRDPHRASPAVDGVVVAPADGVIDDVGEVARAPGIDGPAVRIGIYLSLANVHLNRCPLPARVLGLRYHAGARRATWRTGELERNEQLVTVLEALSPPHRLWAVRQIAGPAARRIVNTLRPGQHVGRGERFGLIKFGSRTELFLPVQGARLQVRIGQRVRAGVTVVAHVTDSLPPAGMPADHFDPSEN